MLPTLNALHLMHNFPKLLLRSCHTLSSWQYIFPFVNHQTARLVFFSDFDFNVFLFGLINPIISQ